LANNIPFIQDMFEVTHNFTIVDHDDVLSSLSTCSGGGAAPGGIGPLSRRPTARPRRPLGDG